MFHQARCNSKALLQLPGNDHVNAKMAQVQAGAQGMHTAWPSAAPRPPG